MRQVREILRMKHEAGLPVREIVRRTGIPRRTVRELLERCAARSPRRSARPSLKA